MKDEQIEFRCDLCGHRSRVPRRDEDPPQAIAVVYQGCVACGSEDLGAKKSPDYVFEGLLFRNA